MSTAADWAGANGDSWAERWRETDRGLGDLAVHLDAELIEAAPTRSFRALDVGCGAGSTSLKLATARRDSTVVGCDLSPALLDVARMRSDGLPSVRFVLGDAQEVALDEGPFDLIFSRHGVMFFPDPPEAFWKLRQGAAPDARLVFSCFRSWGENPWASELAEAAAGTQLPAPGREPSGFAFADPAYVEDILRSAGWDDIGARPVSFRYVAGVGEHAVDEALEYLAEIGPAARVARDLADDEKAAGLERMRMVIQAHHRDGVVEFPAAAWIWTATAG